MIESATLAIVCIIIVLSVVYSLGTQVIMDENYKNKSFYAALWISTLLGLAISFLISVDP